MTDQEKVALVDSMYVPKAFGAESAHGELVSSWHRGTETGVEDLIPKFKQVCKDNRDVRMGQGRLFKHDFGLINANMFPVFKEVMQADAFVGLDTFGRPIYNGQGPFSCRWSREGNPGVGFAQMLTVGFGEVVVAVYDMKLIVEKGWQRGCEFAWQLRVFACSMLGVFHNCVRVVLGLC